MNRNRKRVNYKMCSIIIVATNWCEERNVTDWCERECASGRRAVIDGAPLFNFVCIAVEIMARLCKYLPVLPHDTTIRRLRDVNHWLNACVSRKTCQCPEDRWSKLQLQLFVSSAKVTGKGSQEGPCTSSLMTPIFHCTLADLTPYRLNHTNTPQRTDTAASAHPLPPLKPRSRQRTDAAHTHTECRCS